jgi:hypothetical protein
MKNLRRICGKTKLSEEEKQRKMFDDVGNCCAVAQRKSFFFSFYGPPQVPAEW